MRNSSFSCRKGHPAFFLCNGKVKESAGSAIIKQKEGGRTKQLEVVCGILHRKDEVFIAKRGHGTAEGVWEFPGGKVEPGESGSEAIVRELAEELGIQAEAQRYLCDVMDEQEGCRIHVRAYLCHSEDELMQLSAHSEGKWVKASDVYQYGFQPADRQILDCLQEVMTCLHAHQK